MQVPKLYSPREAANISGWPEMRIRKLIREGKIKYIKEGGNYYLPDDAIEDYVQRVMNVPCQDITEAQNLRKTCAKDKTRS